MVQYDSESCFSSDIVTGTLESEQTSNEISCITPGYTHCYAKDAVIYLPSNVSIVSVILSDCKVYLHPCGSTIKVTVCPSEQTFMKFGMGKFSQELFMPFQLSLKLNKHNGYFAGKPICISVCLSSVVCIGFLIIPCNIQ